MTKDELLAWEQTNRPRAGVAAIASAVLGLLGTIVSFLGLRGLPGAEDRARTTLTTLRHAAEGSPTPPGRLSVQAAYLGDHLVVPILGGVLAGLAALLIFPAMAVLFRATRARYERMPAVGLILLAVGAVAYGLGRIIGDTARFLAVQGFSSASNQSNKAAADLLSNGTSEIGRAFNQIGALVLAVAFVLLCLNAMRAGLLPRFMGVLGMIVGATFVLPLDQIGILRVFWLGALGALLLGRWPRGMPPAWAAGEAIPWPSQQQLREQREARVRGEQRAEPAPSIPEPRAPEPGERAHSASKKKKRKRRA